MPIEQYTYCSCFSIENGLCYPMDSSFFFEMTEEGQRSRSLNTKSKKCGADFEVAGNDRYNIENDLLRKALFVILHTKFGVCTV
jgi:hypothetical protein